MIQLSQLKCEILIDWRLENEASALESHFVTIKSFATSHWTLQSPSLTLISREALLPGFTPFSTFLSTHTYFSLYEGRDKITDMIGTRAEQFIIESFLTDFPSLLYYEFFSDRSGHLAIWLIEATHKKGLTFDDDSLADAELPQHVTRPNYAF